MSTKLTFARVTELEQRTPSRPRASVREQLIAAGALRPVDEDGGPTPLTPSSGPVLRIDDAGRRAVSRKVLATQVFEANNAFLFKGRFKR